MSDDRLEKALQEMTAERVDAGTLEKARTRVWEGLAGPTGPALHAEFERDFSAYLANELSDSRRMLVQDHLSRCPACRARLAGMKGGRTGVVMPPRSTASARWARRGWLAAAAALFLSIVYL